MNKQKKKWLSSLIVALILTIVYALGGGDYLSSAPEETKGTEAQTEESWFEPGTEAESFSQEAETEPEETQRQTDPIETAESEEGLAEDGHYTSKEEVALYLHRYGHLPDNYLTKNEAKELGWDSSKGNLRQVAPGMSIGGDRFYNREEQLPVEKGRLYYECDIDYTGGRRNAKRIVFSNDGKIYYTEDHYESFEELY